MCHRLSAPAAALALASVAAAPVAPSAQPANISVTITMPPQEGNGGSNLATFRISQADSVRITYLIVSTEGGNATGGSSCSGNADYITTANVGVTLNRRTPVDFNVPLCGDTRDEPNETFNIRIAQTSGQQVTPNLVTATIVDDDPTPTLRIADVQLNEPASGQTTIATFNITLSAASGQDVSFNWQTTAAQAGQPATGGTCGTAGSDFTAVTSTPRTIQAGAPGTTVTVTVCGDGVYEGSEHLRVQLANAVNATFADDAGVLTIVHREQPPTISVSQTVSIGEQVPPSPIYNQAGFTVTISSSAFERPIAFTYATSDGTATGSNSCLDVRLGGITRAAGDYITKTGSLSFQPGGATSQVIPVGICELKARRGETFRLTVTATGVPVNPSTATATVP